MNDFLKRLMDILLALVVLIIFIPVFVMISLLIKIDSQGSVLFKQRRLTLNGKQFYIYKFRSMVINAEKLGSGLYNFNNDKRVTKVGRFLRKTSLDELPQILNVLKGEMSFVGPRPSVVNEIGKYDELNSKYKKRFNMKSGITGLAQVSGRNELQWQKKIEFDNKYIDLFKKYGILIDFKIIIITILCVFKTKNTYEIKNHIYEGLSDEEVATIETKRIIYESTKRDGECNDKR